MELGRRDEVYGAATNRLLRRSNAIDWSNAIELSLISGLLCYIADVNGAAL